MTARRRPVVETNQQLADKLVASVRIGRVEPDTAAEGAAVMQAAGLFAVAAAIDRFMGFLMEEFARCEEFARSQAEGRPPQ